MRRFVIVLCLLLLSACKKEQPAVEVNQNPAPVVTPAPPVPPTNLQLQTELQAISTDIRTLREEIGAAREKFESELREEIRVATRPIAGLQSSVKALRGDLSGLQEKYDAQQKLFLSRLEELEAKQKDLTEKQNQLQAEYNKRLTEFANSMKQWNDLTMQAVEKSDLAILALDHIADKKVNKKLGIFGGSELLPDNIQQALRGKAQTISNRNGISVR